MHLTRRQTMLTGAAALMGSHLPALAADPIKFYTLGAMDFMLPLVAQDAGLFKKRDLVVETQIATQAPTLLPAVIGGSLQFGVSTGIQVAIANEAGLDVVIVSGAGTITKGDVSTAIVMRPDSNFTKATDFIGKKVVAPGINGTYYMLFLRFLKQGGVDPSKVSIVEGGFAQMPDLLRTKQVDAALLAEPFLTRAVESGAGKRLEYFTPERDYYVTSVFIAKRSWVEANRQTFDSVRAALREAAALGKSDPAGTLVSVAKNLKLPPEVTAKMKLVDWHVDLKPEDIQFWADVALEFGLLKNRVDAKTLLV
jgi:NitT/TauT family transport system substrate-binding protein